MNYTNLFTNIPLNNSRYRKLISEDMFKNNEPSMLSHMHKDRKYTFNGRNHLNVQSHFKHANSCSNGFCRGVIAAGGTITPEKSKCQIIPKDLAPKEFYENETFSYYEYTTNNIKI